MNLGKRTAPPPPTCPVPPHRTSPCGACRRALRISYFFFIVLKYEKSANQANSRRGVDFSFFSLVNQIKLYMNQIQFLLLPWYVQFTSSYDGHFQTTKEFSSPNGRIFLHSFPTLSDLLPSFHTEKISIT